MQTVVTGPPLIPPNRYVVSPMVAHAAVCDMFR